MRTKTYLASSVGALALGCLSVAGCSNKADCQPGQVVMTIELDGSASDADTIVIYDHDQGVQQSVPHTPGDVSLMHVPIMFAKGYPADQLIELHFQAYGGVTLLGANYATFHTGKTCATAMVAIGSSFYGYSDMTPTD